MMNYLLILCLLSTIFVLSKAKLNGEYCRTPDNQDGNCVPIGSCDILFRMVMERAVLPEDTIWLQQSSQCGIDVCCPAAEVETVPMSTPRLTTPTLRPITHTPMFSTSSRIIEPTIRISVKKCNEYSDFAYNKSYTDNIFGPPEVTKASNCAFLAQNMFEDGEEANRREFPHMALIGFKPSNEILWKCGGTLISEQFVLSAAHCSGSAGTGPAKFVRLGEHDLSQTIDANHVDFNIIERIVHPNVAERTYNDIMLLKLDRQVEFNYVIRPACLPQQSTVPTNVCASGWGRIRYGASTGSNALQKVDLTTFSQSERLNSSVCRVFSRKYDDESFVFAGHLTERRDTCQGDSGGPLQALHDTHHCTHTVFGVKSTGPVCGGGVGFPAVYTTVYSHLDWIEETVWPNE